MKKYLLILVLLVLPGWLHAQSWAPIRVWPSQGQPSIVQDAEVDTDTGHVRGVGLTSTDGLTVTTGTISLRTIDVQGTSDPDITTLLGIYDDYTNFSGATLRAILQSIDTNLVIDLNDLGDVSALAPNDGDFLVWVDTNSQWETTPGAGGSLKAYFPDAPPASQGDISDEFFSGGAAAGISWTEYDPFTDNFAATVHSDDGLVEMELLHDTDGYMQGGYYQSLGANATIGSADSWGVMAKFSLVARREYAATGIFLYEDATDTSKRVYSMGLRYSDAADYQRVQIDQWTDYDSIASTVNAITDYDISEHIYIRVLKQNDVSAPADDLYFVEFSKDGLGWMRLWPTPGNDFKLAFEPTAVGIGTWSWRASAGANFEIHSFAHYFRSIDADTWSSDDFTYYPPWREGRLAIIGAAGSAGNLTDLADVSITSVADGEVLTYDSGTALWVNETWLGTMTEAELEAAISDATDVYTDNDGALDDDDLSDNGIDDLNDVWIASASNNEGLLYNTASGQWINQFIEFNDLYFTSLADPNADRIVFWDDSDSLHEWLIPGTNLTITGNTLDATDTDTNLTQEEVEDYAGAMWTGNTETLVTVTYQDADGTIDAVVDNDLHNYSWTSVDATDLKTGSVTQAWDADLDDLADGTLSKSKVEDSGNWDTAYTHSQIVAGNPHDIDWDDVGSSGAGTTNYVPKFSSNALTNSTIRDTGTGVGIGVWGLSPFDLRIGLTDAIIRLGSGNYSSHTIFGNKRYNELGAGDYQSYFSDNAYWDATGLAWTPERSTLGRRAIFSMGYHQNAFIWETSAATGATVPWTERMRLSYSGDLTVANLILGQNGNVDYTITGDGATNDGVITWMEDEDYWKTSDDLLVPFGEKIYFYNTNNHITLSIPYYSELKITGEHSISLNLGDNAGTHRVYVRDSGAATVAYITSDGDLSLGGWLNFKDSGRVSTTSGDATISFPISHLGTAKPAVLLTVEENNDNPKADGPYTAVISGWTMSGSNYTGCTVRVSYYDGTTDNQYEDVPNGTLVHWMAIKRGV